MITIRGPDIWLNDIQFNAQSNAYSWLTGALLVLPGTVGASIDRNRDGNTTRGAIGTFNSGNPVTTPYYGVIVSSPNPVSYFSNFTPIGPMSSTITRMVGQIGAVNLEWDYYGNPADSVTIERSTDGVNFAQIFAGQISAANYHKIYRDATAQEGRAYSYRITYAPVSSVIRTQYSYRGLPIAPATVSASSAGVRTINVNWSYSGSSDVTFDIYRSTDGSNWASIATNIAYRAGIDYIYVDGNLTEGQRYYYRVRAVNNAPPAPYLDSYPRNGDFSSIVNAYSYYALPTNPSSVQGIPGTGNITINWQYSGANDRFNIERSINGGATYVGIGTVAPGGRSYLDNNPPALAVGQQRYYYRIRAVNPDNRQGNWIVVNPEIARAASNVSAIPNGNEIGLSWVNGGQYAQSHNIYYKIHTSATWQFLANVTANNYTHSQLVSQTEYDYKIVSVDGTGVAGEEILVS